MKKLFITCSWFRFYFYYLFIHMPWNNQVVIFSALTKFWFPFSRDDYDKEVKQAKELQRRRHTTTPRRPRRPDMQVYHPRRRRKTDVLSLDFCADCAPISGKIMCVCVCVCVRSLFRWFRARGRCWCWRKREWIKHRDWRQWDWTLLAWIWSRFWYHYIHPCAQG